MPRYRRVKIEGGLFFFTLALADRSSDLLVSHIDRVRRAYAAAQERRPFETVAICILPTICMPCGGYRTATPITPHA
jgi:putative transposase